MAGLFLLLSMSMPTAANAAGTAQFTISPSQGRPGDPVQVAGVDPCPAIPAGQPGSMTSQDVVLTFIDSTGVSSGDQVVTGTGSDGTWSSGTFFPYPTFPPPVFDPSKLTHEPAVGMGSLYMRCVLSDGTVTQEYAPQPFNVTGTAYRMAGPPTTVQPGDVIHISSVDPCPGDRVDVSLFNAQNTANFIATPDASGAWTADMPAAFTQMDGSLTPFQPGIYGMSAYCMTNATAAIHFGYASDTVTVGSSTPTPVCDDVLFIAAAGSGQHYAGDSNLTVSPELKKVYDGLRQVIPSNKKVGVQVLDYPALSVDVLLQKTNGVNLQSAEQVLGSNIPQYLNGKDAGITALYAAVAHVRSTCHNEAIVLSGYSQGAMVVHQFLQEYAQTSGPDKDAIKAVVLVADPMRVANSQVFDFGTAAPSSYGVCQFVSAVVNCNGLVPVEDIPAMYQPLTTSICNAYDPVCDTSTLVSTFWPLGLQAMSRIGTHVHTAYHSVAVKLAGERAGQQVKKGL
jgi:hypothetical protein